VRAERPRVGVSACLLGEPVRFDAGHKRQPLMLEVIAPQVEWIPVCPEVAAGLGTPREPMELTRDGDGAVSLLTVTRRHDVTEQLLSQARNDVSLLATGDLSGFIFKARSPSCAVQSAAVHRADGAVEEHGRGLFAELLMRACPALPVEEEEGLRDRVSCEAFLARVYAFWRVRGTGAER